MDGRMVGWMDGRTGTQVL